MGAREQGVGGGTLRTTTGAHNRQSEDGKAETHKKRALEKRACQMEVSLGDRGELARLREAWETEGSPLQAL